MKEHTKDLCLLHIAVMLLGFSGTIGQFVTVSSMLITFGRVAFSLILLTSILLVKKESFRLGCGKDYCIIVVAGVVLCIHWVTFFQAIHCSTVAIGIISFSTFPIFVTFLEPLIYHEKYSIQSIICSFVLMLGVMITVPEFTLENQVTVGIMWGMVSSCSFAILSLINRYLSTHYDGSKICFYEQGVVAILLLPVFIMSDVVWSRSDIMGVMAIGFLCTALAYSLYISAQKTIKAQTVGLISGLETVYGILYAAILLQEIPSSQELMGAAIILGVAVYTSMQKAGKEGVL